MARVTIEDISRQTGLSRGTVSRALNDRPDISAQTKQRVLEACRKLNYSPSHAARSLATGRSFALAVLVDDFQSVLAASFLRGVLAQALAARYAILVAELGSDPQQQLDIIGTLVGERIDGVLVGTRLSADVASALATALEERPLVSSSPIDGVACDLLIPDYAESGRLAARHLLRGGNREVLYFHAPRPGAAERLAGFSEVCQAQGLSPQELTVELPPDYAISPETEELIMRRLGQARAIAATDDFLAADLMMLCGRAGRHPGRDTAVMGQGNERCSARITPSLTTVDFCGEEIGRRAAETALQRLAKTRMDSPQRTFVAPQLVARQSTALLG